MCPFGLRNVPAWMQSTMTKVTAEVEEQMKQKGIRGAAVVWMDDVLLGTPTAAEHAAATRLLYEVSLAHNIKYKPPQQVGLAEVVWAGFLVSSAGHRVALSRTEGIDRAVANPQDEAAADEALWMGPVGSAGGEAHCSSPPPLLLGHK